MMGPRRTVASLQTWWLRLFFVSVVLAPFHSLPWWIDLPMATTFLALGFVRPAKRDDHSPVPVAAPVTGRWAALNSPATRMPSHGIRAYGQAFAIDIAHPRPAGSTPTVGWGLRQGRPERHSSFGDGVRAVRPGTAVAVASGQRDHLDRSTWPGITYLMSVEGFVRELGGVRFIVGNHVVLDHGQGVHSLYAHLRRGSVPVRVGDRVEAGQQLGEVGNSGNSSEPHLHFQLMDDPRPTAAAGIPFRWHDIDQDVGGDRPDVVEGAGERGDRGGGAR